MEFDIAMKKILLALALLLLPSVCWAQCSGVFPANTVCGNLTASPKTPSAVPFSGGVIGPGSSTINDLPYWANTNGTQLGDTGILYTKIAVGPGSSTPGDVAVWNNSLGTLLKDVAALQIFGLEPANCIFAGPTSGGNAFPTCRFIVAADIPYTSFPTIANSTFLANFSGVTAAPSAQSVPSCANDGSHALTNNSGSGLNCTQVTATPCGQGVACMYPSSNQVTGPAIPWNVSDMYGNNISSQCSGTSTQCLQEFINYTVTNGQNAEVRCPGTITYLKETGSVTNGSNTISGLASTAGISVGDFVVINGSNNTFLPVFTSVTAVPPTSPAGSVYIDQNAAGGSPTTVTLWFSNTNTFLDVASTIFFPANENWRFEAHSCNITFAPSVTGPGFQFDSFISDQIRWDGVLVYQPSSQQSNSYAYYFNPVNPVPEDGIIVIGSNDIFLSNPVTNGNAQCNICFNVSVGSVSNNHLRFVEVNGGTAGIEAFGQTASTGLLGNLISASFVHGQGTVGIEEGTSGSNQSSLAGNTYNVTVAGSGSTAGIVTYGSDTWMGNVTDTNNGLAVQSGAKASFSMSMSGNTANHAGSGTCGGYINGVVVSSC